MYGTIICLVFLKVYLLHHVVEGCSQCMAGRQVEASEGRKEGRSVGRPDASNVRFVRNCAAAVAVEGGRQQPGQQQREEWHASRQTACFSSFDFQQLLFRNCAFPSNSLVEV